MKASERIDICGVRIDSVTMAQAVDAVEALVAAGPPSYVVTPNADHLVRLGKDADFKQAYLEAALVLPDGMPVLWAGRFLGTPFKEKVSGADLVWELCARAAERGWKIFLLGADPGVAEKAAAQLKLRWPAIRVAGVYSPPYGFDADPAENEVAVRAVREAAPHLLFVALGAPRQEKWMRRNKEACGARVSLGVGISLDYVAGTRRRSPRWMQSAGLEWLWRLLSEPRRLGRRYLVDDPYFFWMVLRQKRASR